MQRDDLKDKTFGKLLVIEFAGINKQGNTLWLCECSCPAKNRTVVSSSNLKKKENGTKSCGCAIKDGLAKRLEKYGRKSPIYNIWRKMIKRCTDPSAPD